MIVSRRSVDYKEYFVFIFGDYLQVFAVNSHLNHNLTRTLDMIYLCANAPL